MARAKRDAAASVSVEPSAPAVPDGGDHRRHIKPARPHAVFVRLSDDELTAIQTAAADAGLTPTGWVGETAVAAAVGGRSVPELVELRRVLLEVMAARTEVRRLGVLINQAVLVGNSTGTNPAALARLAERADQAVVTLDRVAGRVVRALP